MGIDIFLSWENMSKKDVKNRMEATIFDGRHGYLRASIGMDDEKRLLRKIFPEEYWRGYELPYDFLSSYEQNVNHVVDYLLESLYEYKRAKEVEHNPELNFENEDLTALIQIIKTIIENENMTVKVIKLESIEEKIKYASSVIDFLMLGSTLQRGNKNPKVYISY